MEKSNRPHNILIVEDQGKNLGHLEEMCRSNRVDIASSFTEAINYLENSGNPKDTFSYQRHPLELSYALQCASPFYDFLLTDLYFPVGFESGKSQEEPLGLSLALIASRIPVPMMGVLTAGNHHDSALNYSFDYLFSKHSGKPGSRQVIEPSIDFRPLMNINGSKLVICNEENEGFFDEDSVKRYDKLYEALKEHSQD